MMKEKIEQVIELVTKEPQLSSADIANELELESHELISIYEKAKNALPKVEENTFGKSNFFHKVLRLDVLTDRNRIEKLKEGSFVFPDMLELHLGMSCQCACIFCWRWIEYRRQDGEKGLYKDKKMHQPINSVNIKELLKEFKSKGGKTLLLSGGLEFFTCRFACEVIKFASDYDLNIKIYSNGVSDFFSDDKKIDLILDKAQYIRFSLHAFRSETYRKVQMPHRTITEVKSEFETVKQNIQKIVKRNSHNSCSIHLGFLVIGDNYLELEDSINYWKSIGVDCFDIRVDMIGKEVWFSKKAEKELF